MSRLSVHLLTYNGAKYLPYLFASLRGQTSKDWQLVILDNGSTDDTLEILRKELENFSWPYQLIENKENVGFARGHNQMLQLTAGVAEEASPRVAPAAEVWPRGAALLPDYILLLNQDTILAPDYLEKLVLFMDANPKSAAAQGALFRWYHNSTQPQYQNPLGSVRGVPPLNFPPKADPPREERGGEEGLSDIIDCLGLKIFKNRRVVELGAGKKIEFVIASEAKQSHLIKGSPRSAFSGARDDGQKIEVFGVSGTLPIYRRQALEDIAINGEIFDEDFFSYKEDVDLAYRLRSAGWQSYLVLEARAWHERSTILPREKRGEFINYHSYKNHLLTLLKNEYSANFLRDWPWIVWYEFSKFVYLLFFEPRSLKAWKEIFKLWPKMLKKRQIIKTKRKISARQIRSWFQ